MNGFLAIITSATATAQQLPGDDRASAFVAGAVNPAEVFGQTEGILLAALASAAIVAVFALLLAGAFNNRKCNSTLGDIQSSIDSRSRGDNNA